MNNLHMHKGGETADNSLKELNFVGNDGKEYIVEKIGPEGSYVITSEIGRAKGTFKPTEEGYVLNSENSGSFPDHEIEKIIRYLNTLNAATINQIKKTKNEIKDTLNKRSKDTLIKR